MKRIFTFGILALLLVLAAGFVYGQATTTTTTTIPPTAPTLASIGNKDAFEDLTLQFDVTASDVNTADVLEISAGGLPSRATFIKQGTGSNPVTYRFSWTPNDNDFGEHTVNFTVKENSVVTTVTETITIDVFPTVCEDGEVGDLEITDIDLDEDEYFVGDTIRLDVEVDNTHNNDLDVNVEVFLWDVNEEDELDSFESDTVDINNGDSDTFEVELEFPFDNDLDEDTEYIIFVKAFEDGNEEDHCVQGMETVDLERDDNDVIIEEVTVNPLSAQPGETVEFTVDVLNVGNDDQDDVLVEVVSSTLGVSARSERFDIERAGDSDDSVTKRVSLRIPENAEARDHSISVRVLDEDEDAYDRGEEFVTVTVTGQAKPAGELQLSQTSFDVDAGKSFSLQVKVRNTGSSAASFSVDVTPVGGWASSVSQLVSVDGNSERLVEIPLSVKSDTTAGSYTALVELKSAGGETLASKSVTANVKRTGLEPVTGGTVFRPRTTTTNISTVFWIIADVALVVIIIYFIVLLVRRKR